MIIENVGARSSAPVDWPASLGKFGGVCSSLNSVSFPCPSTLNQFMPIWNWQWEGKVLSFSHSVYSCLQSFLPVFCVLVATFLWFFPMLSTAEKVKNRLVCSAKCLLSGINFLLNPGMGKVRIKPPFQSRRLKWIWYHQKRQECKIWDSPGNHQKRAPFN